VQPIADDVRMRARNAKDLYVLEPRRAHRRGNRNR
jgi:hypothetical protein